jgi:glutaredoxin
LGGIVASADNVAMHHRLFAIALLVASPALAQVFKWTDPSGKVHYGDRPPEDARKQELKISIPSYDGPVQVRDWSAVLGRKTPPASGAAAASVTMYSTSWCGHCKNARRFFASKGIAYRDIDVENSPEARREFKQLGGSGVPLILVGSKAMSGWDPEGFAALYGGR